MPVLINKSSANTITLLNIVFGSLSIIATLHENYRLAAIFILLAVIMDGMDGRIARKFGIISDIGKQLDSLCDLVSFGVAPVILLYAQVIWQLPLKAGVVAAVLYIMCGAFRLARFNVAEIKDYFVGIPITLAGAILAFVSLLADSISSYVILVTIILLAVMMISNFRVPKF